MTKKLLIIIMAGVMAMGLYGCGNYQFVGNQKLTGFEYSSGGGMEGGGKTTEISIIQDEVYLTETSREWWYEDDSVTEYKVDEGILEEIENVFRKNKMNWWNGKKFTNMFIADGASASYDFSFDGGTWVSFSSQYYPANYSKKLDEIHEIIRKYAETAELQPGLKCSPFTVEEHEYRSHPDNGEVEIEVYEYKKTRIYYRILNGTNEEATIPNVVKLVRDDGQILYEKNNNSEKKIFANYSVEDSIKLEGWLEEGIYTLYVGNCSYQIDIK